MTTGDEVTYVERVSREATSLEATFLQDMLKANHLTEVEIRDAFDGAITEYQKVVEAQGEQATSAERWMQGLKKEFVEAGE